MRDESPQHEDRRGRCYDLAAEYVKVAIEPQEPDCNDGSAHDYEDGIVWGHGGGVIIAERCIPCGLQRFTDTWAQCRVTGEQGLDSIEYRAEEYDH